MSPARVSHVHQRRQMRNTLLKRRSGLIVALIAMLLAAIPAVASAWVSWDGMDPEIDLGDRGAMSIYVEWPSEMTCDVGSTIDIKVSVPRNVEASVLHESNQTFLCPDGNANIKTNTKVVSKGRDDGKAEITAVAKDADEKFPLNLIVTVNGDTTKIEGQKNNNKVSGSVAIP